MTVKEAIVEIGKHHKKGFNLSDERLNVAYREVFTVLNNSLKEDCEPKSLLLFGRVGCGKSLCMKVMQQLFRDSKRQFMYKRASEIKDLLEVVKAYEIKEDFGYSLKADLYIDDICVGEVEQKKYGNTIALIGEILLDRYELYVNEGYLTHLSTNVFPDNDKATVSLKKILGDRVYDRIKEMSVLVTFKNESLR